MLSGRTAGKELTLVGRRIENLQQQIAKYRDNLASHDHADYQRLDIEMATIAAFKTEAQSLKSAGLNSVSITPELFADRVHRRQRHWGNQTPVVLKVTNLNGECPR